MKKYRKKNGKDVGGGGWGYGPVHKHLWHCHIKNYEPFFDAIFCLDIYTHIKLKRRVLSKLYNIRKIAYYIIFNLIFTKVSIFIPVAATVADSRICQNKVKSYSFWQRKCTIVSLNY